MIEDIKNIFARYQQAGILIDTNILLLYVVGLVNKQRISAFKRTKQFTSEDFDLLAQILKSFQKVIATPSILTEVNSLANQLGEPERSKCLQLFGQTIIQIEEVYQPSHQLAQLQEFQKFGLTDCSILEVSQGSYLVLTDDFRLAATLQRRKIDVINFNHIRFLNWKK
jgi:rRNA-processing protein FCF1